MPRVYHNGAVGIALPPAVTDPAASAVPSRLVEPRGVDPADAGMHVQITTMLVREG